MCLNVFVTCWLLLGRCGCGCCTALGLGSLHAHVEKLSIVAAEAKRHGGACRKLRAGVGVRTSSNLEFGGCRGRGGSLQHLGEEYARIQRQNMDIAERLCFCPQDALSFSLGMHMELVASAVWNLFCFVLHLGFR